MGMLRRSENFATLHILSAVNHTKDISMVRVVSENCLVTAGLDKMVKVWAVPEGALSSNPTKIRLAAKFSTENELMQLKYNPDEKLLAFLDSECSLGVIHMGSDLISGTQRKNAVSVQEVMDDDIDLDAIDEAMGDDNADVIDNIDMEDMKDALSDAKDVSANAVPQAPAPDAAVGAGVGEAEENKADGAAAKSAIRVSSSAAEAAAEDDGEEDADGAGRPRKRVKFNEPDSQYQNSR